MDNHRHIHEAIRRKCNIREVDNLPYGSGRRYNRNKIAELFGELNFNIGAEIGVRRGKFSKILCDSNPNLKLYLVDPWSEYHAKYPNSKQERIFQEAKRNLEGYNVEFIREDSMAALRHFNDESLDFVYIDGNHRFDFVAPDIIFWSQKVKSGGIVACHDYYCFGFSGVVPAVNGYTQSHHIDPWYVTKEHEPTAYWVKP